MLLFKVLKWCYFCYLVQFFVILGCQSIKFKEVCFLPSPTGFTSSKPLIFEKVKNVAIIGLNYIQFFWIGKSWSSWISWNLEKASTLTITVWHYSVTLQIQQKKKTIFYLHHNNTRLHFNLKAMDHITNLGWMVLPCQFYSPDLAPTDFHLFESMKDGQCSQHFFDNDAISSIKK